MRFSFFLTSMLDSRSFADVFQNRCSKHFSQHSELKRDSNTCFPVNIVKFLGIAVLQNFSHDCFCNFLNVIKQPFRKGTSDNRLLQKCPCYDIRIISSSQHIV